METTRSLSLSPLPLKKGFFLYLKMWDLLDKREKEDKSYTKFIFQFKEGLSLAVGKGENIFF